MPRKIHHVDSSIVQGEGTFIKFRGLRFDETKALDRAQKAIKAETATEDDWDAAARIITDIVVDWNWEDDEGNSLPLPSEDNDVFNRLTFEEQLFLNTCLNNLTEEVIAAGKKKPTP